MAQVSDLSDAVEIIFSAPRAIAAEKPKRWPLSEPHKAAGIWRDEPCMGVNPTLLVFPTKPNVSLLQNSDRFLKRHLRKLRRIRCAINTELPIEAWLWENDFFCLVRDWNWKLGTRTTRGICFKNCGLSKSERASPSLILFAAKKVLGPPSFGFFNFTSSPVSTNCSSQVFALTGVSVLNLAPPLASLKRSNSPLNSSS